MNDSPLHPLLAFADLTRVDPGRSDAAFLLQRAVAIAEPTIPNAASVSVTCLEASGATTTVATGSLALECDSHQYDVGSGPCLKAASDRTIVLVEDLDGDDRWPDYAQRALRAGARSSLSVPLQLPEAPAALNIYGTQPRAFDRWAVVMAETLATYASVGLANADAFARAAAKVTQLEEAMSSRAVIEQAKGMLMLEHGCSAEEAFEVLVQRSMGTNRKLRDVAGELVARSQRHGGAATEDVPSS